MTTKLNLLSLKLKFVYAIVSFLLPAVSNAGSHAPVTPTTFRGLVERILEVINIAIPALFAIVFFVIVWKVIDAWVINGGDATKRQEGKQLVMIGSIVFVLMLVTWGVIALLRVTFFG